MVPLINTQDLDNTPLRYQRSLMRLRRYNPVAEYIPGKLLLVSDALSRNPMLQTHSTTEEDVEVYRNSIVKTRSAISRKLKEISNAISMDSNLQEVIHLTFNGWPRNEERLNIEIGWRVLFSCDRLGNSEIKSTNK